MATARRGRGRGQLKGKQLSISQAPPLTGEDDSKLYCDLCPQPFSMEEDLFNHKISKHPEYYEFECGQCDHQLFESLELLEKHFKSVHMGIVEGQEETAEEINNLEREANVVTETIDNYNDRGEGEDTFFEEDEGGVEQEDDNEDDNGGNTFKCPFCPKAYPWKNELTIHLRSHTGEKPYICDECGQAFSVYRSMVDHQKRHNQKYEYFCEVVGCGKGFVKKQDRDRHEVKGHVPMHLREDFKKNQCDVCGKNFTNSTHLKIHVNAVHGKGPGYKCHLCDKSFGHQSSLRSHLQSKKHGGTGLSFRNKKKNKTAPTTTTSSEESSNGGGNLPSVSVPTRNLVAPQKSEPVPAQPVIYHPHAGLHPQFTPNYQNPPQPQGLVGPHHQSNSFVGSQQGTLTLQDAFQMAYGFGGGVGGSGTGTGGPFS